MSLPQGVGDDWARSFQRVEDRCDLDLVRGVAQGHQDALAEIYRRYGRSVTATTRKALGSWSDAEDVVSDVLFAFWKDPENFDPQRGGLLGYLRMKARGRSIDMVRSEVARRRREQAHSSGVARHSGGTDEGLVAAESGRTMRTAVASLDAREREAIELAYFRGMTYSEVAEHLRIPAGTVKSRIRTGLQHLRAVFESDVPEETSTRPAARSLLRPGAIHLPPAPPGTEEKAYDAATV